jgi:hypothetical protein
MKTKRPSKAATKTESGWKQSVESKASSEIKTCGSVAHGLGALKDGREFGQRTLITSND